MSDELVYNSKFEPLFNPKVGVRYFIVTGGRFSSKSYSVSTAICCHVNNQQHRALYTRYTLSSAKDSIIPEFQEKIDLLGLTNYYTSQVDRIEGAGKRKIVFKGIRTSSGNQSAKLKSLKDFSIFVMDEAEEEPEESNFDKINLSIRANDVQNYVVLILNPTTKNHWIYKRFFESTGVSGGFNGIKDNVCYIHTTYLDAIDFVPDDYLREIENLKQRDIEKYNHIILGGWLDKADGVIYKNWSYGNFDDTLQFGYGQDFGFFPDPDVLVKCAIDRKQNILYLDECFCEYEQSTQQLASKTKSFTGSKLIIADGAGKRSIDDLKLFGCVIEKTNKYPGSVEDGIRMVQNFKIVITERSKNIAKELNNYSQKNGVPIDANNHFCDAFRYYVMRHYTEKKIVKNRFIN